KTSTGDAVEFGHTGGQARGLVALAGQRFQREQPALALAANRNRHRRGAGYVFLDQRIPLAAGLALALPAVIRRAAVLADKGKRGFGHGGGESLVSWKMPAAECGHVPVD